MITAIRISVFPVCGCLGFFSSKLAGAFYGYNTLAYWLVCGGAIAICAAYGVLAGVSANALRKFD